MHLAVSELKRGTEGEVEVFFVIVMKYVFKAASRSTSCHISKLCCANCMTCCFMSWSVEVVVFTLRDWPLRRDRTLYDLTVTRLCVCQQNTHNKMTWEMTWNHSVLHNHPTIMHNHVLSHLKHHEGMCAPADVSKCFLFPCWLLAFLNVVHHTVHTVHTVPSRISFLSQCSLIGCSSDVD